MESTATSLSDTPRYNRLCEAAATDDLFFEIFRRHPAYMSIVETLDPASAAEYLSIALLNCPHYRGKMDEFRRNDMAGGPLLAKFESVGLFSPTTLRYVKVASDLERYFGNLEGARIAEIGVGYGGQCRILSCLNKFTSYTLFDLPSAARLARRYLDFFQVPNVLLGDVLSLQPDSVCDLVISNYALSEIRKDLQDLYIRRVLQRARRGYLLYNQAVFAVQVPGFTYAAEEIAVQLPDAGIIRDAQILSRSDAQLGNCLIIWGHK